MKTVTLTICLLFIGYTAWAAEDISGYWIIIDEKSNKPQSIVALYPFQGKYFGRLIVTYDEQGKMQDTIYQPKARASGVVGEPYYVGLDFIWNLQDQGTKFSQGEILDPQKGNVYKAEAWKEGNNLIVRGKLWIFGRNQVWRKATQEDFPLGFEVPSLAKMIPKIPKVK